MVINTFESCWNVLRRRNIFLQTYDALNNFRSITNTNTKINVFLNVKSLLTVELFWLKKSVARNFSLIFKRCHYGIKNVVVTIITTHLYHICKLFDIVFNLYISTLNVSFIYCILYLSFQSVLNWINFHLFKLLQNKISPMRKKI